MNIPGPRKVPQNVLIRFEDEEPAQGTWLKRMGEVFEEMDERPRLILMAARFWHAYCQYIRPTFPLKPGDGVAFRGVQVLEDVDCPGIWLGGDPRENLIPLKPLPVTVRPPGVSLSERSQLVDLIKHCEQSKGTAAVARRLRAILGIEPKTEI